MAETQGPVFSVIKSLLGFPVGELNQFLLISVIRYTKTHELHESILPPVCSNHTETMVRRIVYYSKESNRAFPSQELSQGKENLFEVLRN